MKIAYAPRRANFYPYTGDDWNIPGKEVRPTYFAKVRSMGFEGLELGGNAAGSNPSTAMITDLRKELADYGVPCVCVRGGGGLTNPRSIGANRKRLEQAIHFAAAMGANLVNTTLSTPTIDHRPGHFLGEPTSQGGSRDARESDFLQTAQGFREVAQIAADHGVDISIEVHQHSIVDNSWAALRMLELIDRPNVGINPDLGNIYWTYETPEESSEQAILALASRTRYWHCKNLKRIHIPENNHTLFLRVPLPDGDIDYRFAIATVNAAGFDGYLAIEGARDGDYLSADGRGIAYVRTILGEI